MYAQHSMLLYADIAPYYYPVFPFKAKNVGVSRRILTNIGIWI